MIYVLIVYDWNPNGDRFLFNNLDQVYAFIEFFKLENYIYGEDGVDDDV